ncbi:sulfotransferase domain-containing protein [Sulfitobacter aestuariivivens]|uniref:sulfotransferase domain-containing protein n=1 Tax=Sulfitobacter aestuariivivens TaxID=2766981 RepID=UPI0036DD584C
MPKETMFFSRKLDRSQEDFEAYCKQFFDPAGDEIWRGEGSTTYLQWPDALGRMRQFLKGRPKFIVCLRQPTAKAISFYIHNWRRDRYAAELDLQAVVDMGVELSPFRTSLYADALERWLDAFPAEDFLFLKFDDLVENPHEFVSKATRFLGLPEVKNVSKAAVNAGLPLIWEGGHSQSATVPPAAKIVRALNLKCCSPCMTYLFPIWNVLPP